MTQTDQDAPLLFEVSDYIATFTLNRPDKRNAFTDEMVLQLAQWLEECRWREDVRVIVITATGTSFSAGGDTSRFKEKAAALPLEVRDAMRRITQSLARKINEVEKPVIAAVNGTAVGGGMDLALLCDMRLATTSAKFAETYIKMGLVPGVGGAWFLPRLIGKAAALDMFWTARWVDANEALRMGLVNRVFADDDFAAEVRAFALSLAQSPPQSLRLIKSLVSRAEDVDLATHLDCLASHIALVRTSHDHSEAVAAAKDKRPAVFRGN